MKIVCVISSLAAGGSERVMTHLANQLAEKGHQVEILTFQSKGTAAFYPLHPSVVANNLGLFGHSRYGIEAAKLNLTRLMGLRRQLKKICPQAIISFGTETNVTAALASVGLGANVVVSERADPRIFPRSRIWRIARQLAYPLANAIVVQSRSSAEALPRRWLSKIYVVANPVEKSLLDVSSREKVILAVGRLGHEKGFDCLIQAFGLLASKYPDWNLRIVGEGSQRATLTALICDSGLEPRVTLAGLAKNVALEYSRCSVFALSSRTEGFPNVLCEAMAAGMAVVATDCAGSIRDIIVPGENGLLVPVGDDVACAQALENLMCSAAIRESLGRKARMIADKFSPAKISGAWEHILTHG